MESDKILFNISPADCLKVYPDIIKNSDRNWSAARTLALKGYYGQAISLNIISVEELIKSLIIVMDGHGFRLRNVKGINRFFKEHPIRHYTAFLLLTIYLFAEDLISLIENTFKDQDFALKLKEITADQERLEQKGMAYLQKQLRRITEELPYFIKMENYRQLGFYCDYTDQFHTPEMITQQDYGDNQLRLKKVKDTLRFAIGILESDKQHLVEYKTKAKDYFRNNHIYEHLGSLLNSQKTVMLFEKLEDWLAYMQVK